MNVVFPPRVVNTIKALPADMQAAISNALVNEFILGRDPLESLTPSQSLIYTIVSSYVKRE